MRLCVEQGKLDIFAGRSAREQIKSLKYKTDFSVADASQLGTIELANIKVVKEVAALRQPIEAAQNIHHG